MRWNARFGCVLAALWLVLALAGASPQLHQALHEDANAPDHSCVIEHIAQGAFVFMPADAVAVLHPVEFFFSPPSSPVVLPARDHRVALSRGPPSLPTFRTVAG